MTHEVNCLVEQFHSGYGMDLELAVGIDGGAVTVRGGGLALWGPRQMLEARLDRAGLRYEVRMPGGVFVIHPSTA